MALRGGDMRSVARSRMGWKLVYRRPRGAVEAPVEPAGEERITEDGEERITESGEVRVTEG